MYNRAIDISLLLLRVVFGLSMMFNHGWSKLLKLVNGDPSKFADPLSLGPEVSLVLTVFAEVLCSFFLVIGLFSRFALVPLMFAMTIAFFVIHGGDPFAEREKALLFLAVYIALFISGPGWFSIDGRYRSKI